ncbi:MAG TPA: HIT family protein [Nitrospiraceae bacterium]|nr:HIT family protein [Nitrospiraceae bacterium]
MAQGESTVTDPACKACQATWPRADHFIADLGLSKAYLHDDQFFPGWTVVVLQRHATELFHLAPTERIQLMEEVNLVARVIAQVYEARKINYELLGNQLPHIHWHIIPRLANDPAPLEPVWRVVHLPVFLSTEEVQTTSAHIKSHLLIPRST